ncbi:hypothetical protein BpHYR1_027340 [Brachionus plicatilis]|uniref:Uncharacterized protein n=1 Tax=Brachionus plicatilis TaxID=10195 RepID=A0A3M7TAZ6_BRAPC|nr:hypothetical protein BpHYR1_027340 [Brachionus plicatilis]
MFNCVLQLLNLIHIFIDFIVYSMLESCKHSDDFLVTNVFGILNHFKFDYEFVDCTYRISLEHLNGLLRRAKSDPTLKLGTIVSFDIQDVSI